MTARKQKRKAARSAQRENAKKRRLSLLCSEFTTPTTTSTTSTATATTTTTTSALDVAYQLRDMLLLSFLNLMFVHIGATAEVLTFCYRSLALSKKRRDAAKKRERRERPSWSQEDARMSDRMFYRLFRMTRPCFRKLCKKIERTVGPSKFKSESYLEDLKRKGHTTRESSIYNCSLAAHGPWIPGEVKLAMTLRLLAGASYLDMFLWFNVEPNHVKSFSRVIMRDWLCNDKVLRINYYEDVLYDTENCNRIRSEFAVKSSGVMSGVIGALDGWLVKICSPTMQEVHNPGKYFSRKGFYALNVQAIVDLKKRIIWRHIGEKGSSHDSPCFHECSLGMHLMGIAASLRRRGLYIVGDSAYAIRSYLLTPYDNAEPESEQDSFNFFLSSKRIYSECAFGEIDRRWGIFWKPLEGSLCEHKYTIDAALRLHNYIVDNRENLKKKDGFITNEEDEDEDELNVASDQFIIDNPLCNMGFTSEDIMEDAGSGRGRGRLEKQEEYLRKEGRNLRDKLCAAIKRKGLTRKNTQVRRDRHNRTIMHGNQ